MSCGCKTKNTEAPTIGVSTDLSKTSLITNFIHYSIKILGFLIALALLPILILVIVYYMFNLIVISKDIDIKPLFTSLSKFIKKASEDDDEEDDDDDVEWETAREEDYIMIDVDDLSKK